MRAKSSQELHAIGGHLYRVQLERDLSVRQEWLWDAIQSELQHRRRQCGRPLLWCSCALCCDPFNHDGPEQVDPNDVWVREVLED